MSEPVGVRIVSEPAKALSDAERERYAARIAGLLDRDWMLRELARIVDIPSPLGEERPLAERLARLMGELGLQAAVQPIDAHSANAIGQLGDGDGPSVMLFAPLDSALSGIESEEVPWIGPELRADHKPVARIEGDGVIGLSADNPKASIIAIIAAVAALRKAEVPLAGRVVVALGAGGAPSNKRPANERWNVGHGTGCEFLLQQGVRADYAIVVKPGFAVQWEEVGVCWFRVRVHGSQSYVGRKHVLVEDNAIVKAAAVIPHLEAWFREYSARHTDGLVAPQGAIGAIQGGWTYKPAFTPAACDIYVDMRVSPRSNPMEVWRELNEALRAVNKKLGYQIDCALIAAVEGPGTPETNWIPQSCIRAWEAVEGRKHEPFRLTSGQTEAVIFRRHGIPTARVGMPAQMSPTGGERMKHSMGITKAGGIVKLAEVLARTLIDTCTRNLEDVRRHA
ncbi:MAG: peptidase dimerization domain-containing protein [Betaproteobacteria bacterium]